MAHHVYPILRRPWDSPVVQKISNLPHLCIASSNLAGRSNFLNWEGFMTIIGYFTYNPPKYNKSQSSKKDKDKVEPKEPPAPDKCTFCNIEIKQYDTYWLGYDINKIFAATCDNLQCNKWLKWKTKRRKE